jgi:hypothetical protein
MEIRILLQTIHWNSLIKEEKYGRLKKTKKIQQQKQSSLYLKKIVFSQNAMQRI